jgi:TetR/AcrR family transcriptional regulator, transcriptional repressor for nem operon
MMTAIVYRMRFRGKTIAFDIVFFSATHYVGIRLKGGTAPMGVTKEQAVHNRKRILAAAERLFRQKGVDAVGLAELMKEAGFTQGGFYNHFASKEALVSEVVGKAVDESQQQLGAAIAQSRRKGTDPLISNINWYLSRAHRDDIDRGCAIAGFVGEAPHLSKPAQVSYSEAVESTLNQTANMLAEKDSNLTSEHAYARAIALYSHMVGSVLLSRAISASRPALADKILKDAQASIFASLPPASDRDPHHRAKARPKRVKRLLRKRTF